MSERKSAEFRRRSRAAKKGWRNRRAMFRAFASLLGDAGFKIVKIDRRTGDVVAEMPKVEEFLGPTWFGERPTYYWRSQWGISR